MADLEKKAGPPQWLGILALTIIGGIFTALIVDWIRGMVRAAKEDE